MTDITPNMSGLIKKIRPGFVKYESVSGLDKKSEELADKIGATPLLQLRTEHWMPETIAALTCIHPVILVERLRRKKSLSQESARPEEDPANQKSDDLSVGERSSESRFEVLGAGLAWSLVKNVYQTGDSIPSMIIEAKRLSNADRLNLIAAEILALPAIFHMNKESVRVRLEIWKKLNKLGHLTTEKQSTLGFNQATGHQIR